MDENSRKTIKAFEEILLTYRGRGFSLKEVITPAMLKHLPLDKVAMSDGFKVGYMRGVKEQKKTFLLGVGIGTILGSFLMLSLQMLVIG